MERYLTFPDYCRRTFGRKLYRAALDCGMTCPNRDGTCGDRGCIFCSSRGSGDFAVAYDGQKLAKEDLVYNHQDAPAGDYIAYFQSYTNTYAPAERLYRLFSGALADPLFAGISVATRPDCLENETVEMLEKLRQEHPDKFIWIELGLQTIHEKTAVYIRRGYPLSVFDDAVERLHKAGIPVIVHVIIGLPGEDEKMVLETVRHLNTVGIQGIKLQLLHYLKDSDLGSAYMACPEAFHPLDIDEYAAAVAECIAVLDPSVVIHRISGDGNGEQLLAPLWSRNKKQVLNRIRHELKARNIIQGCRYAKE